MRGSSDDRTDLAPHEFLPAGDLRATLADPAQRVAVCRRSPAGRGYRLGAAVRLRLVSSVRRAVRPGVLVDLWPERSAGRNADPVRLSPCRRLSGRPDDPAHARGAQRAGRVRGAHDRAARNWVRHQVAR